MRIVEDHQGAGHLALDHDGLIGDALSGVGGWLVLYSANTGPRRNGIAARRAVCDPGQAPLPTAVAEVYDGCDVAPTGFTGAVFVSMTPTASEAFGSIDSAISEFAHPSRCAP